MYGIYKETLRAVGTMKDFVNVKPVMYVEFYVSHPEVLVKQYRD